MSKRNENRPGYKETKLGWIPNDWDIMPLGGISKVTMGQSPSSEYYNTEGDGLPLIQGNADIYNGKSAPRFWTSQITKTCQVGDILLSVRAPVGEVSLSDHVACIGRGICSLHFKNRNLFLNYYLSYFEPRWVRFSQGSTFGAVTTKEIKKLSIPIPSLPEQRKISEILSAWDRAIELVGKQIEAKQQLKKGLMQQLLTGKVRFPGFGKPAVGDALPDGWQEVRMNELGEYYSGLGGKSKNDFGAGKPYIPYLNIFQNNVVNSQMMDYVRVMDGENQNLVKQGDVFFTLSSETPEEVGMSSVLLEDVGECYLNSFCMGFRLSNNDLLLPDYAVYLFRGSIFRRDIYKYAQGSTRFNLSKRGFMKMAIKIPNMPEQRKITELFFAIDQEISRLIKKSETLRIQKQGLMQKLLIGEVRV